MKNFVEIEQCCEAAFQQNGPFFHLYTSGAEMGIIFRCGDDYVFGMNLTARCVYETPGIAILIDG